MLPSRFLPVIRFDLKLSPSFRGALCFQGEASKRKTRMQRAARMRRYDSRGRHIFDVVPGKPTGRREVPPDDRLRATRDP
ncbi:hypothetical protein BE61_03380 [Bradyrhizobium elkanii USDA 61]|nr:hypothetical protein BE61_03380 [Bradyrhizobium elkanii USDA 61]